MKFLGFLLFNCIFSLTLANNDRLTLAEDTNLISRSLSEDFSQKIENVLENKFGKKKTLDLGQSYALYEHSLILVTTNTKTNIGYELFAFDQYGKNILSSLKKPSDCLSFKFFTFNQVEEIEFKDMDQNQKLDVLVLASYIDRQHNPKNGPEDLKKTMLGTLYLNAEQGFKLVPKCFISNSLDDLEQSAQTYFKNNLKTELNDN